MSTRLWGQTYQSNWHSHIIISQPRHNVLTPADAVVAGAPVALVRRGVKGARCLS
jgi:hypothetical protein